MNPAYNYIFLDFETTGLDINQDFPIQIGIIKTDEHLHIIDQYTSYITLPDTVLGLKANISYLTGIDIDTIQEHGQDYTTITKQISHFFDEKTIIIGQNISFDLGFLKKFFPNCTYHTSIDTYPLAISTIPYLKTYSLEGIDQYLSKIITYTTQKSHILQKITTNHIARNAHDALYDCCIGICFLHRWLQQYQSFTKQYPYLKTLITQCIDKDCILSLLHADTSTSTSYIPLPLLISPTKTAWSYHHTPRINREKAPQHSKYSTKMLTLEQIIQELPDPCIIALSHASKIDIIKKACPQETFSFFKQDQIIDQDKIRHWLQRGDYSYSELLFVFSYLSHLRDGYRIIQAILPEHRYILDYLQTTETTPPQGKILCSHGGLYHMMEQEIRKKDFSDYPICVLDADRRHITYNDFAQKGISLNHTLFLREKTLYELSQESKQEQKEYFTTLLSYRELFIGYFGIESEKHLEQLQKLEIDYLPTHPAYTKSYGIRKNFIKERVQYCTTHTAPQSLNTLINKLEKLFEHPIIVRRQLSNRKDIDYTIGPSVRYIDFAEYLASFGNQKLFFFSGSRNEYQTWLPQTNTSRPNIMTIENTNQLLKTIESYEKSIFIISHHSEKSKKLFQALHNSSKTSSHKLLAEYLTGGIGKITSLVNTKEKNIIIGGYHVLLQLRSQGKTVDLIIIHAVHNSIKQFIQADIAQYAPKR